MAQEPQETRPRPSFTFVSTFLSNLAGPEPQAQANRFTEAALARHKREGMELAVRARWAALAVVGVLLALLNPVWEMLYYHGLLLLLALVGLLAQRVARVGLSRMELAVLFLDLALTTIALVVPNPFLSEDWPTATTYQYEGFLFFFIVLASGTLAYSWRTIVAIGTWTAILWMVAAVAVWWFGTTNPSITQALQAVLGYDPELARLADPNLVHFDQRFQQIVIFFVVAAILALSIRRFNILVMSNASLERERENLSRYFSPNVVEVLSQQDEPLKQIRSHDIAVLFVDIVDFTAYASERNATEVIYTLRDFHSLMEAEVFRFDGTLDKYLGDGLMATFGTPVPGQADAVNALRCARAMRSALRIWNDQRAARGEPQVQASIGLHFGPVVLGDIGSSRLEFTVVGNTVNVASRVEALTRTLPADVALTDDLRARVIAEVGSSDPALTGLAEHPAQHIRGLERSVTVWSLS